jgi:hypothetical protein
LTTSNNTPVAMLGILSPGHHQRTFTTEPKGIALEADYLADSQNGRVLTFDRARHHRTVSSH